MTKQPFKLVPDQISHETVEAARELFEHANKGHPRRGRMIGVGFIAMYSDRSFIVNAAGECYRSPDVTRGYLAQLHDALGRLARGEQMPAGW